MTDALIETWLINNRVNLLLLGELSPEALRCTLSTRGGRTVGQQWAHVYEVRRSKVEAADKALAGDLPRVTRTQGHDPRLLTDAFERSGEAVAELIRRSAAAGGRVKGFRRGIVALVGYFIAHDAHHRGHILLTLKQCQVRRSDRLRMGLWEWNKI
ncbi:MAG: DinB family protein [Planctomycetota bacterium]